MRKRYIRVTEENKQFVIPALEKLGGENNLWEVDAPIIGEYWFIDYEGIVDNADYITYNSDIPPKGYTEVFLDSSGNIIESAEPSLKDKYRSEIIEPALKSAEPSEIEVLKEQLEGRNVIIETLTSGMKEQSARFEVLKSENERLRACLRFFYDNFQALAEHGRSINNNGDIRDMEVKAKELLK